MEGERKLVTVMFADIRGSFELVGTLGEERRLYSLSPWPAPQPARADKVQVTNEWRVEVARYDVCSETDIPVGAMKGFKVDGESVLIYHLEDGFYATQSSCTHVFAPLRMGKLVDGCKIQCPFHAAQFDVRTGEVVRWANFPPGIQLLNVLRGEKALRTYAVTLEDGQLRVDV